MNNVFCKNCNKELAAEESPCSVCGCVNRAYKMEVATAKFSVSGSPIRSGLKRGDISWAYFPIAYGILLTISVGVIQIIEPWKWYYRIILILLVALAWLYLCFFNGKFRRIIVNFFTRSKEFVERF